MNDEDYWRCFCGALNLTGDDPCTRCALLRSESDEWVRYATAVTPPARVPSQE